MPALAQTKPWRVSTIRTPRSARSTSLLSSRISSTRAGSLPSTAASLRASAPGSDRGEAAHPALRLGDDLLGDDDDVALLELGARGDQLAERRPLARSRAGPRPAIDPRARPRAHMPRALAVRLAAPAVAPRARRVRATTSAGVSRSSASEGSSSTSKGTPASRAAATWRAQLPSPKAGRIASGGRERQGVGAGRRGGRGRSRRSARARRSAAGRARAGRAAGSRRGAGRRSRRRSASARAIPASAASTWPSSSGSGTTSAPAAAAISWRAPGRR